MVSAVTSTVTEKGYARHPDGTLDLVAAEGGFYPLLTEGSWRRRDAGVPRANPARCDNLLANGCELERLLGAWLEARDPELTGWVAAHCAFPSTMVDRHRARDHRSRPDRLAADLGRDEGAVFTERFGQWVIEDAFCWLSSRLGAARGAERR